MKLSVPRDWPGEGAGGVKGGAGSSGEGARLAGLGGATFDERGFGVKIGGGGVDGAGAEGGESCACGMPLGDSTIRRGGAYGGGGVGKFAGTGAGGADSGAGGTDGPNCAGVKPESPGGLGAIGVEGGTGGTYPNEGDSGGFCGAGGWVPEGGGGVEESNPPTEIGGGGNGDGAVETGAVEGGATTGLGAKTCGVGLSGTTPWNG